MTEREKKIEIFRSIGEELLELLFPRQHGCFLCGEHNTKRNNTPICEKCLNILLNWQTRFKRCSLCGRYLPLGYGEKCGECLSFTWYFDIARSFAPYQGSLKEAIYRFKYRGRKNLARPLGYLLKELLVSEVSFRPHFAVPVPLFPQKLKERGYNQALLLSRELGQLAGIKVKRRILKKSRSTSSQAGLSRLERLKNVRGSFTVNGTSEVRGKRILLIDDVFTTGATASECSRVLREAGACKIAVLTVAGGDTNRIKNI